MTKLNYVNRKSEGVKLGQIVAKDLRKRSASHSNSSSHKDTTHIELLLDKKSLTDDGLVEIARGLEDTLLRAEGSLAILNLTGNALTSRSLSELATTIRAASEDLQELDLSANSISVITDEDATNWTVFLHSLRRCRSLRSLDLSGNNLGGARAWEIFARAFEDHFNANKDQLEHLADDVDDFEVNGVSILGVMQILSVDANEPTTSKSRPEMCHIRGLPSIATFYFSDVNLDDAGALWLSFWLGKHRWIQERLHARQSRPGVCISRPLLDYSPNKFSTVGQKLIKYAEAASYDPLNTVPPVPENSPMSTRNASLDAGRPRRFSFSTQHHRKVSSGSADDHDRPSPPHLHGAADGMGSLRRKLQRTQIEELGLRGTELWHTALNMLNCVRCAMPAIDHSTSIMPSPLRSSESTSPDQVQPPLPRTPSPATQGTYASKLVVDTAEIAGPALSIVGTSSTPVTPQIFRHPRARHENFSYHSNSNSPKSTVNGNARVAVLKAAIHMTDADEEKIGSLPLRAWVRTLRHLFDPQEILSDRQVENVVRWGRDRSTLAMEAEGLGKPKSVQIWRVLEGMGCLSYED